MSGNENSGRKPLKEPRYSTVMIRLTEKEKETLVKSSSPESISSFVRLVLRDKGYI